MKPMTILPKVIIAASCSLPLLLTACGSSHQPRTIAANNPSVTYQYRGDRELLQANQEAINYCSQYNATPRTVRVGETSEGRAVTFECVPAETQYAPTAPYF